MDNAALLAPQIQDAELFQEFVNALADHVPNIERDVAKLKDEPTNKILISNLFRSLHTVKGDAAMCKVQMGVLIVHPVETLLARLRNGDIGFSELLTEAVLLSIDRLELATQAVHQQQPVEHLKLVELVEGLDAMANAPQDKLEKLAETLIHNVTGFYPVKNAHRAPTHPVPMPETESVNDDLEFFQSLAQRHETRSPLFRGRSERLLRLALETNAVAGNPVDPTQLTAAVYMHDIGMLFLPESLWLGTGILGEMERWMLHEHPDHAAGMLERMPGWKEAADIVRQHHERHDGSGYPKGLRGKEIHPGAKILAIVDAFESVTIKHSEHGERRSLIRAIAEINASDSQFDAALIQAFNTVIRRIVEG